MLIRFLVIAYVCHLAVAQSCIGACIGGACPDGFECSRNKCCRDKLDVDVPITSTSKPCVDRATDCEVKISLCNTKILWWNPMAKRCQKTCGFC